MIAILEVPKETFQGTYKIELERWRRNHFTGKFQLLGWPQAGGMNWKGWGTADPSVGVPIRVVQHPDEPAADDFNPLEGWGLSFSDLEMLEMTNEDLRSVTPNPYFQLNVPGLLSAEIPPAAWEMKLTYTPWKFKITDVNLITEHPSDGLVTWKIGNPSHACGTPADTLTIQVVEPKATPTIRGVRVAFETQNFMGSTCNGRAFLFGLIQEVANSFKAYDKDGLDYAVSHDITFCEGCN